MKAVFKISLWFVAGVTFFVGLTAALSSASEWWLLKRHQNYVAENFSISGTRVIHGTGDEGTSYYLHGSSSGEDYDFAISAADYSKYSSPTMQGEVVQVYRDPNSPSVAFQQRSLNVIFADEWRELDQVEVSVRSTLWIAIISFILAGILYLIARLSLPPLIKKAEQNTEAD